MANAWLQDTRSQHAFNVVSAQHTSPCLSDTITYVGCRTRLLGFGSYRSTISSSLPRHRYHPSRSSPVMLASLRSLISSHPSISREGYAPISAEETRVGSSEQGRQASLPPPSPIRARNGKDVYFCFWALGAGILLSWNGKCDGSRCAEYQLRY